QNSAFNSVWRRFGPYLSERQWGTVREDYSEFGTAWDYFPHDHARSRAYRWRRRHRRLLGSPAAHLFFARALERTRSDPQRAAVRARQRGGQPRRGRERAVLLPRRNADALVPEDAVQVSAGRVPLFLAGGGEPPSRATASRVRAGGHGRVRRRSLLRCLRRVRQGGAERHADPHSRVQSRPRDQAPAAFAP